MDRLKKQVKGRNGGRSSVFKLIIASGMAAVFCKTALCATTADRALPGFYTPGYSIDVTLTITIDPQNPPNGLILEEAMPEGWTIFFDLQGNPVWNIEPAQNVFFDGIKKWVILSPVTSVLTYTVSVPVDASGECVFSGTAYNTVDGVMPVGGDALIYDASAAEGDINGDGEADISDVILCLRMAVGLEITVDGKEYNAPYGEPFKGAADMNGDGDVDISDVILLLRRSLGLPS